MTASLQTARAASAPAGSRPTARRMLHSATSGRALVVTTTVLAGWALLLATTSPSSTWRLVVDVLVLGGVHVLAALVSLRDRLPGAPGPVARSALGIGLGAFAVAAVLGRIAEPGRDGGAAWALDGLHLLGQAGIAVVLISLIAPLRDRLLLVRIGLDAVTTTLGVTAVAGTVVLIGIGTGHTDLPTRVVLVLTGLDVLLVAGAVALFSVLRPGRDSVVPPLLVGSVLLLAADLASSHSVHFGGPSATAATSLLMAGACLVLAGAVIRPVNSSRDRAVRVTDRLSTWSNVLPFAGTGANLLAVLIAERSTGTQAWGTPSRWPPPAAWPWSPSASC